MRVKLLLARRLFTSCLLVQPKAWFLTGHGLLPVHSPGGWGPLKYGVPPSLSLRHFYHTVPANAWLTHCQLGSFCVHSFIRPSIRPAIYSASVWWLSQHTLAAKHSGEPGGLPRPHRLWVWLLSLF